MNTHNYVEIYRSLGDISRLRIISLLLKAKNEMCCCDFAEVLKTPTYNICKHMKILRKEGLIIERKEGRRIFYSVARNKDNFIASLFKSIGNIDDSTLKNDVKKLATAQKQKCDGVCESKNSH
jgi:ArsR family transcriptional regulator, arsenate/arsenite/antimonite-responsive transcriptional repressor